MFLLLLCFCVLLSLCRIFFSLCVSLSLRIIYPDLSESLGRKKKEDIMCVLVVGILTGLRSGENKESA